jgi:hypothetical protein
MGREPDDAAAGNGAGHRRPGIGARVHSLGRAAQSFSEELRSTAADLGRALDLRGRTERHPYLMTAAALGLGYVLGGGLFTRTTARALGLAGRLSALPLMRSEFTALAEALLSGDAGGDDNAREAPGGSDIPSPS